MVKKRSKLRIRIMILFSIILGLFMMLVPLSQLVKDNLAKYSVYYAGNLPHKEGTDPELVAILDNLDKIYIPNLDETTRRQGGNDGENYVYNRDKKYQYDFSGNGIYYRNSEIIVTLDSYDLGETFQITSYENNSTHQYIDSKGSLILITDKYAEKKYKPEKEDFKIFEKEKELLFGNIIKAKQKPPINLQFIYNYLNESKFK